MGFKKETTQVQQSQMKQQKQLQYVKGNYPGAAPFFFENGKIFYIYNDCLVGTYETEDKDEITVWDIKGKIIGKVQCDGEYCADATLWNIEEWYSNKAKVYLGTGIYDNMTVLNRINTYKREQKGKKMLMSYVARTFGFVIEDYNNDDIKYAISNSDKRERVGIMATFICMQAVDPRAPFHSFYTID